MKHSDSQLLTLLVTGAAGFVGTNFLRHVTGRPGVQVVGVYHERKPIVEGANIRLIQADLLDPAQCQQLVTGIDQVYMFAGRLSTAAVLRNNPLGPVTENTVMNLNMLDAAFRGGVTSYVWLSSSTGYPPRSWPLREPEFFEEEPPSPYESVGWMSRYIEKIGDLYARRSEGRLTVIALRPSGMYGPYDDFEFDTCHALPALMRRVLERHHPIEMWGSGNDERDYVFVDDVVEACLLAARSLKGSVSMNIGSGKTHSLNELLALMLRLEAYEQVPVLRRGDLGLPVVRRALDCRLARALMKFQAKTSIEAGLRITMDWRRSVMNADFRRQVISA